MAAIGAGLPPGSRVLVVDLGGGTIDLSLVALEGGEGKAAPLAQLLRTMTVNPARLLGLDAGRLAKGAPADLVLFDPDEPWMLNKDKLKSRSKNSPFDEARLTGRVLRTVVAGETVYQYAGVERS